MAKKSANSSLQELATMLLSVTQLFFGLALAAESASDSGWPLQTFVTEPNINPPVFSVNKTGATADGYIFLDTNTNGALASDLVATIITDDGEVIWSAGYSDTTNPSLQTFNGEDVIIYWEGELAGEIGRGYGKVVVMNTSYVPIYNVTLTEGIYVAGGKTYDSYLDAHESLITTSNTLIATVYNTTQADLRSVGYTKQSWILDCLVYEIDVETSEVLWSWSAADHADQIPFTASHEPISEIPLLPALAWDYFHINAVAEYGEGYLISSRTLWSIFYVSKATGDVLWYYHGGDGGNFSLPALPSDYATDELFKYQHDIRVLSTSDTGLTISLFNNNNFENGNLLQPNTSYGLEVTLDTAGWTSTLDQVLYDAGDAVHTIAEGDRQTLDNGGALVNYGFQPRAKEFTAGGELVWSAQWGTISDGAYRARKFAYEGRPRTVPSLAVEKNAGAGSFTVYVSWNGATEVSRWQIVGCGAGGLVSVAKAGFETSWTGSCAAATVHALALSSAGATLATSNSVVANSTDAVLSNSTVVS